MIKELQVFQVTTGHKVTERRLYVVAEDGKDAAAIVREWLDNHSPREQVMRVKPVRRNSEPLKYLARK